jgi:hypothetical protein
MTALSRGQQPGPEASIAKVVVASKLQDLSAFAMELEGEAGALKGEDAAHGAFQAGWMGRRVCASPAAPTKSCATSSPSACSACRRTCAWTRTSPSTSCRADGDRNSLHQGLRHRPRERPLPRLRPHAGRDCALGLDERGGETQDYGGVEGKDGCCRREGLRALTQFSFRLSHFGGEAASALPAKRRGGACAESNLSRLAGCISAPSPRPSPPRTWGRGENTVAMHNSVQRSASIGGPPMPPLASLN